MRLRHRSNSRRTTNRTETLKKTTLFFFKVDVQRNSCRVCFSVLFCLSSLSCVTRSDKMGCGSSKTAQNVQTAKPVEKKTVLPPIDKKTKTKTPSAKSNGSTDSGIEDSEPIKRKDNSIKSPLHVENLFVEHHQKSRLGHGETFEIVAASRPSRLAPLKHVPKFIAESKSHSTDEADLQAKIAAKQERASRKRREIEDARRQASSRIGYRAANKTTSERSNGPVTTTDEMYLNNSKRDERRQQLSMLRDQLRRTNSNNSLHNPMHTPRADSVNSNAPDTVNLTPRRGATMIGATTASNFKPVYD